MSHRPHPNGPDASPTVTAREPFLQAVKAWIWISALANLAGWSLSAVGQLNRAGYAVFFFVVLGVCLCVRRPAPCPVVWTKYRRRFRRPLPGAFAALALLVLAGSLFYAPTNWTGLNYHLGRVLQWLSNGAWWWIHTPNHRMNYTGCGYEWVTAPLVLFTGTDRVLFLVNYIPFLLLPGLVFGVLNRMGVNRRAAWYWMWLLPAAYNVLLQAGSIGNDTFGSFYALAGMYFACRAWQTRHAADLWHGLLAVGMMTAVKPTSIPLLLPWAILVAPLLPLVLRRWLPTLAIIVLALVASYAPSIWLNYSHTGDWAGQTADTAVPPMQNPLVGVLGNIAMFVLGNFFPPVFPMAGWWNSHIETMLPATVHAIMHRNFVDGILVVAEVPTEDYSGLGFGVTWLVVISAGAAWWLRRRIGRPAAWSGSAIPPWLRRAARIAAWVALLAYSVKATVNTGARLISPYYFLLILLPLAIGAPGMVVRQRWWRVLAGGTMVLALMVLVLSPDRPLWPAQTVLNKILAAHPGEHAATRALKVYSLYASRNDCLAGVRTLLPPDAKAVGFVGGGDDCDTSLWKPLGTRQVWHFLVSDPPEILRSKVEYVAVGGWNLAFTGVTLQEWLNKNNAELLATTNITVKIVEGPQDWYITRLKRP